MRFAGKHCIERFIPGKIEMELLPENGDSSNFVGTLRAYAFDFKDKDQALFRCLYRLTVFLNEGDFRNGYQYI